MIEVVQENIAPSGIQSGMIINLSYTKVDGGGGNYSVFVINPSRTDASTGLRHLHGYIFNGTVSESQLINLLVNINAGIVLDTIKNEIRLESISDSDAYEAKYLIPSSDSRPYRKFNIDNIGGVTKLSLSLPTELETLITNTMSISAKSSKRKLFDCLQEDNMVGLEEIPEIKIILERQSTNKE